MPYNTVIGIDVGKDSDQAQLWARRDGELGSWGRKRKLLYSFQLRVLEGEHFPWGKIGFWESVEPNLHGIGVSVLYYYI